VTYPKGEGITFDHEYYANSHVPMCEQAFNPARVELDTGIDGPAVASVSFYFADMDKFNAAMASPKMGEIMADLGNYTNGVPTMQISKVVK
jgi:uncharacterized protein (TIGR02118 family)